MKTRNSTLCVGFVLALMATASAADAPQLSFEFTTVNVPTIF
jgi:hypothetical protein